MPGRAHQGCPQDVKSQDRDETETVNLQDRDVPFFKLLRLRRSIFPNSQDRDETRRDVQPSRPRRDRDVPKNISRPQCCSLKTPAGEACHLTSCFLRVRSIIFFLIYPQVRCIAWMFTRLKSRDRDRDVISSRPRCSAFKTETRRDDPKNVSRLPRDRDVQDRDYIPGAHCVRACHR